MADEIISMEDMMAIYTVTDRYGIDREHISVPLEKLGAGSVARQPGSSLEITVPDAIPIQAWLPVLQAEIERLGFQLKSDDEDEN